MAKYILKTIEFKGDILDVGYSSNDYSSTEKQQLATLVGKNIESGAQVNVVETITLNGKQFTASANSKDINLGLLQKVLVPGTGISIDSNTNTISCTLGTSVFVIAQTLPTTPPAELAGKIYVVPTSGTTETNNIMTEWLWNPNTSKWEKIGEFKADVDLSSYALKSEVNEVSTVANRADSNASSALTKIGNASDAASNSGSLYARLKYVEDNNTKTEFSYSAETETLIITNS